ncbi:TPA: restriction endonuclease subunit S [Escherichia coli]|uniref:restriction endonuclease subunit S n=1 Tax=Escherichia coli TaxID=562 RepID=UPI0022474BCF|nr:restriction endonuclease subunit S [Escherichia coli]EKP5776665.1 restriction endonuclease subunit S [Escherichia coli]MCX2400302.1 restriction endonuclease subunit S [Escherichia coli]MDZ6980803.1 restriction endonuclease subunit S [Escherichia coli]MEC6497010.1 restriction endonuclease subunit S [Escherichia coli]HAX7671706.1 restriction endonuclease subunit S [Escherichia coli]
MVPKGWLKYSVGELCTSIVPGRNKPKVFDGDIPWVTTPEINGRYIPSKLQVNYVSTTALSDAGGKIVPQGAVVMAAVGELGLIAITSEPVVLNQQLHAFVCSKLVNNEYLAYWLTTQKPYMESIASKTTIPYMNKANCESIPVLLPPLAEQFKIAQILLTWDNAISVTEKLLTNSQQQKKALMQQLLTGKKRLLDENGVMFSGEWEVVRLKQLIHEEKKRNRDNHIQRVLSVTNHSGFVLPEEQFSKRVASEDVSTYKIVKKNQYGYNPSRLNVGSFARLDNYDEGVLSPMYVVFSINHERLNSDYFLNWMSSNEAKQRIAGSTQGSVRDSVGFDALCSFSFSLPTLMEQQKIAAVLSAADAEMSMLEKKLACLKEEKKALMQQLLTGKRRVKVESEETVSA